MGFKITFQEFNTEHVTKGKNSYEKGVVTYTSNGQNKNKTMMSFTNPAVFNLMKKANAGMEFIVETTKNAAGYDEWASVVPANAPGKNDNAAAPASSTRVAGSNYETREERAARQVLIVKQSSLSAAVATLSPGAKTALNKDEVLALADVYASWVFASDEAQVAEELKDVPY